MIPPLVNVVLSNITLFLLIGGMAGTTDLSGFREQLKNYKGVGTGVACQFFLLPLLGFLSVQIFSLDRTFGIMLLLVTTSPGGGFSGWWCSIGNADIALSVAMTTVSTIVSIGMLPLNLLLYVQLLFGTIVNINWFGFGVPIAIVIAAVMSGLFVGTRYPQWKTIFNRIGTLGGLINIVLGLVASQGGGEDAVALWDYPIDFYFAVGMPCLAGLLIAFGIARVLQVKIEECVSICIECCYQNTGLAITVALTVFTDPEETARATAVPIIYAGFEIALIAIFVLASWKLGFTYAPANEPFLKCISGNYQPKTDLDEKREAGEHAEEMSSSYAEMSSVVPPTRKGMARLDGAAANSQIASHQTAPEMHVESETPPETVGPDSVRDEHLHA
mmetsp:Transcript_4865/g.14120  ORF Transcript_4865/g.14120 Transcript_4865/m.14120 type:complete len:388 (+) Transcript_4865:80-1243(+)